MVVIVASLMSDIEPDNAVLPWSELIHRSVPERGHDRYLRIDLVGRAQSIIIDLLDLRGKRTGLGGRRLKDRIVAHAIAADQLAAQMGYPILRFLALAAPLNERMR
ncbi:hypothetical protein [Nitrobacter sp.]|uniref:hypothetical protein n=1 Tax=Nitrobacter sp. TaxID=29420 RepID=UPI00260FC89B|nr:hypothetical protein [Nitrobacter sp.]